MNRFRITYQKIAGLRYTSHLDLQKIWIRALLRAKIPLAYTQGFHPAPKISPAWPLPLGWSGLGELIDIWMDYGEAEAPNHDALLSLLNHSAPPGLVICAIEPVDLFAPSLTTIIQSAEYSVFLAPEIDIAEIQSALSDLLRQETILRVRRDRTYDLRPLIESCEISIGENGGFVMNAQMVSKDSAMGRPDEIISAIGLDPFDCQFARNRYLY